MEIPPKPLTFVHKKGSPAADTRGGTRGLFLLFGQSHSRRGHG